MDPVIKDDSCKPCCLDDVLGKCECERFSRINLRVPVDEVKVGTERSAESTVTAKSTDASHSQTEVIKTKSQNMRRLFLCCFSAGDVTEAVASAQKMIAKIESVVDDVEDAVEAVVPGGSAVVNSVIDAAKSVVAEVETVVAEVVDKVETAVADVVDKVETVVATASSSKNSALEKAVSAAKAVAKAIALPPSPADSE